MKTQHKRWMPYNVVFGVSLADISDIRALGGVDLLQVGSGYQSYYLNEAMLIADSEIVRMMEVKR